MLRSFIRHTILSEGLAHFGNNVFMRKIAEKIKTGDCYQLLGLNAVNEYHSEFQWKLNPSSWEELWDEAEGEYGAWLHKKFFNKTFFVESWSSIAFALVKKTWPSEPAGQQQALMRDMNPEGHYPSAGNIKTRKWRPTTYWTNKLNSSEKDRAHHNNYISFWLTKEKLADEDKKKYGYFDGTLKLIQAMQEKPDWPKIAGYIIRDLDETNNIGSVWTHEMQHWVQAIHYLGTESLVKPDYTPSSEKRIYGLNDNKHQKIFSGLKSSTWLADATELDAEIGTYLSLFVNKLVSDSKYVETLCHLIVGDTKKVNKAVLNFVLDKQVERGFKARLRKNSKARTTAVAKRFTDFLQECVENSNAENYLDPNQFRKIFSTLNMIDKRWAYETIKETGYLKELKKIIDNGGR